MLTLSDQIKGRRASVGAFHDAPPDSPFVPRSCRSNIELTCSKGLESDEEFLSDKSVVADLRDAFISNVSAIVKRQACRELQYAIKLRAKTLIEQLLEICRILVFHFRVNKRIGTTNTEGWSEAKTAAVVLLRYVYHCLSQKEPHFDSHPL